MYSYISENNSGPSNQIIDATGYIVNGNVLMLHSELFDCVPTEPDNKFNLVRMSASTCGNGHQLQMKVTDWEMYLRVTHVLLNFIFIYTRYFVSCSV